ncbi:MAG: hypothetical protein IJT94_05935 [Oscillibacter sp.]|nr:hypothetical protein [Oscillibacter sp.]
MREMVFRRPVRHNRTGNRTGCVTRTDSGAMPEVDFPPPGSLRKRKENLP